MFKLFSLTILLVFATAVNFANATPIKITQLATPTSLTMSPLKPYTFTWNTVDSATSYRIIISKVNRNGEYFLGFNNITNKCDSSCVTFKVSDPVIFGPKQSVKSYDPPKSALDFIQAYGGPFGLGITIRAGSSVNKESAWSSFYPLSHATNTPFVNNTNEDATFELNLKSIFMPIIKKISGDAGSGVFAMLLEITKAIPGSMSLAEAKYFRDYEFMLGVAEQMKKSNWIIEAYKSKNGWKSIKKASGWFVIDIFVDAFADRLKAVSSNKKEGTLRAWGVKLLYLGVKSTSKGVTEGLTSGEIELISGLAELNFEIWGATWDSYFEFVKDTNSALKSKLYGLVFSQTNETMKNYAHADSQELKNESLKLLTDLFSYDSFDIFPESEITEMKNSAVSTVLDFNETKFKAYESLLSKDGSKAQTFLNTYFSVAEKECVQTHQTCGTQ